MGNAGMNFVGKDLGKNSFKIARTPSKRFKISFLIFFVGFNEKRRISIRTKIA